jgi:nucleoside-diphosphate-sugar epimerase
MKKVIIVGANGFLGSRLALKLASSGINVLALVETNFENSVLRNNTNVKCINFDLDNLHELQDEELKGADALFHMAWSGVNAVSRNDGDVQVKNVIYGLEVMKFAVKYQVKKVILPGSAAEYSCGEGGVNGENLPAPSDMYSASKVAQRVICETFAKQKGLHLVYAVITSVYGPGRNDNNLISYAITSLLKGEKPSFTKLEQMWDYIYIDDLIDALVALGKKGIKGRVYAVGSGQYRKMSEYVNIIHNAIDNSLPIGIGDLPYKTSKVDNQIINIDRLKEDTGFKPKYSFEKGISLTIEYFKRNINDK